jgi:hypothetical protein
MRVLIKSYGNVSIFYCKMLGFKRYYVSWRNGTLETYSSLWYNEEQVIKLVEDRLL